MLTEKAIRSLKRFQGLGRLDYLYEPAKGVRIVAGTPIEWAPKGATGVLYAASNGPLGSCSTADVNLALSIPLEDIPMALLTQTLRHGSDSTCYAERYPNDFWKPAWPSYVEPLAQVAPGTWRPRRHLKTFRIFPGIC